MSSYKDLMVWQRSKELAVYVYRITRGSMISKDYSFIDQMRRSAVSISSNIAEGDELESDRQSIRYFFIAKGSSAELLTQAIIAFEIEYLSKEDFNYISTECDTISRMLANLIRTRRKEQKRAWLENA